MKSILTVVIVNWNAKEFLRECLSSISSACTSYPYEVMVVDNASTDGSQDMIKKEFSDVKLIELKKNLGYGKAANVALRNIYTRYVLLLNSDVKLYPQSIDLMVKFALSYPKAGVVAPMVLNEDGTLQHSVRRFPSFKMGTFHALLGAIFPQNPYTKKYKLADWDYKDERKADWVSGACMLLNQGAVRQVGFFDEGYFMYAEDMDLCWRMHKEGFEVWYTPSPKVVHYVGASSRLQSFRAIIEHHKSIYRFLAKFYYGGFPRCLMRVLVGAGLFARASLLLGFNFLYKVFARK